MYLGRQEDRIPNEIKEFLKSYLDSYKLKQLQLKSILQFMKGYGADVIRLPDGRSEPIFVTYDL